MATAFMAPSGGGGEPKIIYNVVTLSAKDGYTITIPQDLRKALLYISSSGHLYNGCYIDEVTFKSGKGIVTQLYKKNYIYNSSQSNPRASLCYGVYVLDNVASNSTFYTHINQAEVTAITIVDVS